MSYQVLARKYRPQTFKDVIGQEHITELLKKAIETNRVAHAYLFCGPRGIGKTTCARILAMCLNCEGGPKTQPPVDSPICADIMKGNSLDCIEIDGASNRGIDEIRSLRENVKFSPSYSRFKIYIVDEVHMLTTEAFNALLKTLEEPPAHVKFIFATTEPNKVPATIISRCQRFDFKRISIQQTIQNLKDIAHKEKLKVDEEALYAIAKAAQGSMRDALSVLDQMSALSDRNINAGDVYSMLGLVETQFLFDLSEAIARKDCAGALKLLEEIVDKGKDVKQLTKDLSEHFRHLMVIKVGGKALSKLVDYSAANKELLDAQCQRLSLKEILIAIDAFILAQETARITETQRMPLELALAKLTYQGDVPATAAPVVSKAPREPIAPTPTAKPTVPPPKTAPTIAPVTKAELPDKSPVKVSGEKPLNFDLDKIVRMWDHLTHTLSREKMSLATYLQEGKPVGLKENLLVVGFPKHCKFSKENLETKDNILLVEKVFGGVLEGQLRVKYEIIDDFQPKEEEPTVKNILDEFGGKIVNRWHNE